MSLVDALMEVRGKMPELICFRLNPGLGRTDSETKSNVLGGPDAKFGIPPNQVNIIVFIMIHFHECDRLSKRIERQRKVDRQDLVFI